MRPLTRAEVSALRQARNELSNQLQSAEGRRQELVQELRSAPEAAIPGIQTRLKILDERIAQIEVDIQTTGRQLALAPRAPGVVSVDPNPQPPGFWNSDVAEFAGVMGTLVLAFAFVRVIWTRARGRPAVAYDREAAARMERLEQAVDAIAIEVERVGEAQRWQAKLLNEGAAPPISVASRERVEARNG